ncbi:MAG: hypothetical protein HYS27_01320 [Deltaproteobacteria bacterium]|nr:hypothetical protein [Deltaproteobacteria bacterium]
MRALLLSVSITIAAGSATARPDDPGPGELFTFDAGDTVEIFDTARFRLHYARAGDHAVPAADSDTSGVPDYVEGLGDIYESVLDRYLGLGFRAPVPDNGADPANDDARFDVYLVDFGLSADGAFTTEGCGGGTCWGYMVQENDFAGYGYPSASYANRLLASHELFHAVQAAYDDGQGQVIGEGTAVWASEQFDDSLGDYEGYSGYFLDETNLPLDATGGAVVSGRTYGSVLFWQFLTERFGEDAVRRVWEASVDGAGGIDDPYWFDLVDTVAGVPFADLLGEFAAWTIYTDERADPSVSFAAGSQLDDVITTPIELPLTDDSFLVFDAGFQALRADAAGRTRIEAALAGDATDVRLALFAIGGGVLDAVAVDGTRGGIDVGEADEVWVQLVNSSRAGGAARPGLCIGDAAEVDACLAELEGPPPPDGINPPAPSCLGCSGTGATTPMTALLALALWRRRRRVSSPASAARATARP